MSDLQTKCEVCGSLLDEEDLFCANCGTEAPAEHRQSSIRETSDTARVATYNFQCSGCGASMSYDASAATLECPFCGSREMVRKQDSRVLSPNRVVPFQVNRDEATRVMRQWLGRGFWRPTDLAKQAAVVKMTPVYVPYWVFHAHTHTFWTADTDRTPAGARGDWCPMAGEHEGHYGGVLVGASGVLTPHETSQIAPFDLATAVAPDEVDLGNITVEQFSMPRKYARPLARQGIEQAEAQACDQAYVPGRARNVHVNVRIQEMSSEPVLLPVWIMAYRFNDRVFRFLVNGQTGRASGQAPTSWAKIAVAVAAAGVGLFVLLLLVAAILASL